MKKILSILVSMVLCMGIAASAGCGGTPPVGEVAGKTNITVATYNGGVGKDWLEDAARAFEEQFAERSFEDGKTGVAVRVEFCEGADMMEEQNLNKDVYFTELFDYYTYVNKNKVADISDVVTTSLEEVGEPGKTIEGKLDQSFVDFLTAKDGNYYAIPFYEGFMGFIYDVDVFAQRGYFFDEDGNFTGDETKRSLGIDGEKSWDDGLPETYSDFQRLVDKIRGDNNITPIIYGSDAVGYFYKALTNWWSNYEGKENMLKNWDFTGTFDIVTGFSGDEPIIGQYTFGTDIASDVRELQKQPGKYYALKFLKEIVCGNANNYESLQYQEAQEAFIASRVPGEHGYAMILDGSWWENEADLYGAFDAVSYIDYNYDPSGADYKHTRRFAFMPIPLVDEVAESLPAGQTHKQTLYSGNDAFCFISSNTTGAKLDVAKLFLKFLHTDEQMSAFTARTSLTRALNYEMGDADLNNMTYFGKSVMEMKQSSDIVYPYSANDYYLRNSSNFVLERWGWTSKVGGGTEDNPFVTFVQNANVTAADYFRGLYEAH